MDQNNEAPENEVPEHEAPAAGASENGAPQNGGPAAAAHEVEAPTSKTAVPHPLRRRNAFIAGGATIAIALAGGGFALGASATALETRTSSSVITRPGSGSATEAAPHGFVPQSRPTTPFGGSRSTFPAAPNAAVAATADEQVGIVTIVSSLYYSNRTKAAGTGIVLSPNGRILTNNHVISGATSIEVTVESSGETYQAKVVGTDATKDIAMLQLVDASGLVVAGIDATSVVAPGDGATSIGNAKGTGNLVAASGTVTAIGENITVGNENTGASESLNGLIRIDADVVSGDSGGPLLGADGKVIGVVTAASSGSANITGYAIPIATAQGIVDQIDSGVESGTVKIGNPAFLGIQLSTPRSKSHAGSAGAVIGGVIADTPAAVSGLTAGDVITSVNGAAVASGDELSAAIAAHNPGDTVTLAYADAAGASHRIAVALVDGPAA